MSEKQAKRARAALKRLEEEVGPLLPRPGLNPLPDEAEDTRRDRRTKRFRKKVHAAEMEQASHRRRMLFVNKWNRVFSKKKPAQEVPATDPQTTERTAA